MLKVGLTGGIGCGKTRVAELFSGHGVPVIDADVIARDLVRPGQPALTEIVATLGHDLLKAGQLDRKRLREQIFADPAKRRWLEALLHPPIYEEMRRRMEAMTALYCVLVVPLLLETAPPQFVNRVLVVDCTLEVQRKRVCLRDKVNDEAFDQVVAAQMPREVRVSRADDLIDNSGSLTQLSLQVERLHQHYLQLAEGIQSRSSSAASRSA